MNTSPLPQLNEEQPPVFPEVIKRVNKTELNGLSAAHIRKINRLKGGMKAQKHGGVICIVLDDDGEVVPDGIYQVRQFKIGPAEK